MQSIEVFCSYAHEDEMLRDELAKHLRALERSGLINLWHDGKVSAGAEWKREIDEHLSTAHITLLLVSPDYINSDYCYSFDLFKAMKRHESGQTRVIPIILHYVYWQGTPLGNFNHCHLEASQ